MSASLFAQADQGNNGGRQRRGGQNGEANANGGGRGNFDPAQIQEQMMARMREQFEVKDDAEWTLISERLAKVTELRQGAGGRGGLGGGFGGGRGPGGPGGGGNRGGGGRGGNPEVDALRSAIADKLPDAEIKSRLDRVREVRKENEVKLVKAQEDLRAVLTVRQEAVAVMFGMLP